MNPQETSVATVVFITEHGKELSRLENVPSSVIDTFKIGQIVHMRTNENGWWETGQGYPRKISEFRLGIDVHSGTKLALMIVTNLS